MVTMIRSDLDFILAQIKIAEADAAGIDIYASGLVPNTELPWGLRRVDGSNNNLLPGQGGFGAADQPFPVAVNGTPVNEGDDGMRFGAPIMGPTGPVNFGFPGVPAGYIPEYAKFQGLSFSPNGTALPPNFQPNFLSDNNYGDHDANDPAITNPRAIQPGDVVDADPRIISNLIVDQTANNPAAVFKALQVAGSADPMADMQAILAAAGELADAKAAAKAAAATVTSAQAAVTSAQAAYNAALAASGGDPLVAAYTAAAAAAQAMVANAAAVDQSTSALVAELAANGSTPDAADFAALATAQSALAAMLANAQAAATALSAPGVAVADLAAANQMVGSLQNISNLLNIINLGDSVVDGFDTFLANLSDGFVNTLPANAALLDAQIDAGLANATPASVVQALAALNAAQANLSTAQSNLATANATLATEQTQLKAELDSHGLHYEESPTGDFGKATLVIENVAPDAGLSSPFNGWMTLFGQFFDHGLDLVGKGGFGTVYIPLQPDDPLYVAGSSTNFMALTRATLDTDGNATNKVTPFVDQNQTYTSNPSAQVFHREYEMRDDGTGNLVPTVTGRLLNGVDGGLATWADIKAQALNKLGIALDDFDIHNIPELVVDPYGNFIPGPNGFPQVVTSFGPPLVAVEGSPGAPVDATSAQKTGHAFLDDIAHNANPDTGEVADSDTVIDGGPQAPSTFDNELLDRHFITGDGRGNENIGLTAVHHVFHAEHNRQIDLIKETLLADGDLAFLNEWLDTPLPADTTFPIDGATIASLDWNGERLFQAAKLPTEMQYQHLVFEEFARTVQPFVNVFNDYNGQLDPAILGEFAHTVYRFGHSMLTETVDRLTPDNATIGTNGAIGAEQIGLIEAFLNPVEFNAGGMTAEQAAGAIARGMTRQTGNEIDEFVTEALRNNLVGLPLDLAALNLARGRELNVPTLNEARAAFYAGSSDTQVRPYTSWADFAANLKNPVSVVNFIAAYGTHSTITSATTVDAKRDAAMALVLGGTSDPAYADRLDFLNARGPYSGGSLGGLNAVDFWVGGLAEKQMAFGGMLGTTFNFVFEVQMENLQNGDRFYYLSRLANLNLTAQLENNKFAEVIARNTDASHLPGNVFKAMDYQLEVDQSKQLNYGLGSDDPTGLANGLDPFLAGINGDRKVIRADLDGDGDNDLLQFIGGEHVVLGGTEEDDVLIGDEGDDTLWGDGGDDRIEGGIGNDFAFGGAGNDIITDQFGDDEIRSGAGDDVVSAGQGINLIITDTGNDFVWAGDDLDEILLGQGDDFGAGGADQDTLIGGEGNDWLESGLDNGLMLGDNGDLIQGLPIKRSVDSGVVGHDVLVSTGGNADFDAEQGDDVMVGGYGTDRFFGQFGFDWATYKNDAYGIEADMNLRLFAPPSIPSSPGAILDRYAQMEALSGSRKGDILRGDDVDDLGALPGAAANTQAALDNALTDANIALTRGLDTFLGTINEAGENRFSSGNILLGGSGSDIIEGRGGNDLIDGNAWLNVRIEVMSLDGQTVLGSYDGMADLQQRMFSGEIKVSQLRVVRELIETEQGTNGQTLVNGPTNQDDVDNVDIAQYSGVQADYAITDEGDGFITVTHLTRDAAGAVVDGVIGADGVDKLKNSERLMFSDGVIKITDHENSIATGAPEITGTLEVGSVLSVSAATIDDDDGVSTAISYYWQVELEPGSGVFTNIQRTIADELAPATGPSYTLSATEAGLAIRVLALFKDGAGVFETVVSQATTPIGGNGVGGGPGAGTNGDDILVGTPGADILQGFGGNDTLIGLAGNDILDGGTGTDTAVIAGLRANFQFGFNAEGDLEVFDPITGEEDALIGIEFIRFDDVTLTIAEALATIPTAATDGDDIIIGTEGDDDIDALGGNDTVTALGGADKLVGGAGNDTIDAGAGDDDIFWSAGEGTDTIDGGTGTDRLRIEGSDGDETFFVERVADYLARTGANAITVPVSTEIVISRSEGVGAAIGASQVITYARGIDDIDVRGNGGTNEFVITGDFTNTDLNTNTITITGSAGSDIIDLAGLLSSHKVHFISNGGDDQLVGMVRDQDVIELPGAGLGSYVTTTNADGTKTISHGLNAVTFSGTGQIAGAPANGQGFNLTASDLAGLKAIVTGGTLPNNDDIVTGVRTLSGEGNNLANPNFGAADQPFIRITDAHYGENGALNPIFNGLDPRNISNIIGAQEADLPNNAKGANAFFTAFGQYFDHGLDFIAKGGNGKIAIGGVDVPGPPNPTNPADLTRATVSGTDANGIPQHTNKTSNFIDQNQAYGSNDLVGRFLLEASGNGNVGSKIFFGGPDPSNPAFDLLPTLRQLINEHWTNNTKFTLGDGTATTFQSYYAGLVTATGFDADIVKSMAGNFMGSGHALLLDTNPFINLLDHVVAGDGRANENITLTSIHTIWARNHNFHVDNLEAAGFVGTDKEIFEAAKALNEAEYQRVVFTEFADALIGGMRGSGSHGHDEYNPDADPGISHEFAAAVYRVGHSLISDTVTVLGPDGQPRDVRLFDAFLNPSNDPGVFNGPLPPGYTPQPGYAQIGADAVLGGIIQQTAEEVDFNIVDAVRNDLVRINADLFAFNVARGRDVGLGTLNQVRADLAASTNPYIREAVGFAGNLSPYSSWDDFKQRNNLSAAVIAQFIAAYPDLLLANQAEIDAFTAANPDITLVNGNTVKGIDRVDLWVGGLAEQHINDGMVGQTFWVVLHEQFDRLQEADRFYYTDRFDNFDLYETHIDGQNFADIIARNTGLTNLPEDIFSVDQEDQDDDDGDTGGDDDNDDEDDTVDGGGDDGTGGGEDDNEDDNEDDDTAGGDSGTGVPPPTGGGTTLPYVVYIGTPADNDAFGAEGDDRMLGAEGDDALFGFGGDDTLVGGVGDDDLTGGAGDDALNGGAGNDRLFGDAGDDTIIGDSGHDIIEGGAGNDNLFGDAGRDRISGGSGNDVIFATAGDGNDAIDGGDGADTLDLQSISDNIIYNVGVDGVGVLKVGLLETDTIANIENIIAGSGNDTIYSTNAVNMMNGGAGSDTFVFRTATSANGDSIVGFEAGDHIDLSPMFNSLAGTSGVGFSLINETAAFTGAGQMRLDIVGDNTVVEGSTDGDNTADFKITVVGRTNLTVSDFT